jgi:hypothetical protein
MRLLSASSAAANSDEVLATHRYAYPDGGAVIDTSTKKVVASIPTSEKLIEVDLKMAGLQRQATGKK